MPIIHEDSPAVQHMNTEEFKESLKGPATRWLETEGQRIINESRARKQRECNGL